MLNQFKIYYNSNPNLPKTIRIGNEDIITNHIGKKDELTEQDSAIFKDMVNAISFLRECSNPITKEYEITDIEYTEEELLLNKPEFISFR